MGHEFHHWNKIRKSKSLLAVVHIPYLGIHGNKQERGKLYTDEKTDKVSILLGSDALESKGEEMILCMKAYSG